VQNKKMTTRQEQGALSTDRLLPEYSIALVYAA
jgi:hypothetical protein